MMGKIKNIGTPGADVEGKVQKSIRAVTPKLEFLHLFIYF